MNAHRFTHFLSQAFRMSPIQPFRRVASIGAAIMIGAASLGSPSGLAKMIPLKLPDEFDRVCQQPKPADPGQRTQLFWKEFDRLLYHAELAEVVKAESGEWPKTVLPKWRAYADAAPAARADARRAWLASLQAPDAQRDLLNLGAYQLKLFQCFFPSSGPTGFDGDEVTQAFEALALGRYSPPNDPMQGRMDTIGGWVTWYAFADAAVEIAYTPNNRLAWETLRRMSLYGLLLHAHYDTRPCPGAQCQRAPQVMPAGLASTDMGEIKRFVGATDTAAAELEAYGMLKAQNPQFLGKVVVPQSAPGRMGAMNKNVAAKKKTVEELEAEVAQLRETVGGLRDQAAQSELAIDTLKTRNDFVVLAFFDFDPKDPVALNGLAAGRTTGLPTIMYNWECNPCYKVGNTHWIRGVDNGKLPDGWKWTYIATKQFSTPHEAEAWLTTSDEGRFISQYAKVIMRTTVTGYTPY